MPALPMKRGRPQIFPNSPGPPRQISVQVTPEDYELLSQLVEKERITHPGFGFGDLLRQFIRNALAQNPKDGKRKPILSPAQDRIRRLHAISTLAKRLARELQDNETHQ